MLSSLSISRKLIAAFAVNIVIVALMMTMLWNASSVSRDAAEKLTGASEVFSKAIFYEMAAQRVNAQVRGYVITGDEYYAGVYQEANADLDKTLNEIDQLVTSPQDRASVDATRAKMKEWLPLWGERLMALARARRNDEAMRIIQANSKAQILGPVLKPLRDLRARQQELTKEYSERQTAAFDSSARAMAIGGIALMLSVIGLCFLLTRAIASPISRLTGTMQKLAAGDYSRDVNDTERRDEVGDMAKAVAVFRENGIAKQTADAAKAQAEAKQKQVVSTVSTHLSELSAGDLTTRIDIEFPAEYAALKSNFNEALDNLRGLISACTESTAAIRTGSGEIAQASEDLARRTESNAASLEETAASVTQMDGRLKASATAASRTVERADQAIATVGGGRAVADEAVQAMGRVSESAKGIDSVIEGLDKIAFQTRVLAMNAAVEAGRAGDAGRGFAVVADLVSALAMRAEEEAKRARDQLTVTQTDIVTAVEAVQKVDGALANISGDVGQVHELLATMAADNQAQAAAITQISSAIGTMDQATQQNAAMVEETSAAARNLAAEVGNLADQAGRFKVDNGARPVAKSSPARSISIDSFAKPPRPLPAAAIPALRQSAMADGDDWKEF